MTLEEAIEHAQGCVRNDVTSTSGKALIALLEAYNAKPVTQRVVTPAEWLTPLGVTPVIRSVNYKCAARASSFAEPADCDWPVCGCDPHANKVIEALEECHDLNAKTSASPPPPDSSADAAKPLPASMEGWTITLEKNGNWIITSPSGDAARVFADDDAHLAEVVRQMLQTMAFGPSTQPAAIRSAGLSDAHGDPVAEVVRLQECTSAWYAVHNALHEVHAFDGIAQGTGIARACAAVHALAKRSAAIHSAGLTDWQLIETAPKGRKIIAGYHNKLDNWRTITATYYAAGTLQASDDSDNCDEEGYAPEGWYEESESHESILPTDEEPTHWMPLPQEPGTTTPNVPLRYCACAGEGKCAPGCDDAAEVRREALEEAIRAVLDRAIGDEVFVVNAVDAIRALQSTPAQDGGAA